MASFLVTHQGSNEGLGLVLAKLDVILRTEDHFPEPSFGVVPKTGLLTGKPDLGRGWILRNGFQQQFLRHDAGFLEHRVTLCHDPLVPHPEGAVVVPLVAIENVLEHPGRSCLFHRHNGAL
jgi:hypothetical protein